MHDARVPAADAWVRSDLNQRLQLRPAFIRYLLDTAKVSRLLPTIGAPVETLDPFV